MGDNTITIALEGDVELKNFTTVMLRFQNLIDLLSREVAGDQAIVWTLDDLQYGSAIATIAGIADDEEPVLRVIDAYARVGQALERHAPIPYSPAVAAEASHITRVIGGNIIAIRFETAKNDYSIYSPSKTEPSSTPSKRIALGVVKGRVQSISNRHKLRFTLYDALFDKPVSCYLEPDQEDLMREIWGNMVLVSGRVTREPDFGRATAVRDITSIEPVRESEPGDYKRARGALSWSPGDEPAEAFIRRLRDG
jgi:hypothetical protein